MTVVAAVAQQTTQPSASTILLALAGALIGSGGVAGIVTARVNAKLARADEAVKKADVARITVDAAAKAVQLVTERVDELEAKADDLSHDFAECERHRLALKHALERAGIDVPD